MGLESGDYVLGRGIDRDEVIRIVDLSNIEEAELLLSSAYVYDVGGLRYLDLPAIADDVKALREGSNFLVVYSPGRRGPPSGRARALASSLCSSADPRCRFLRHYRERSPRGRLMPLPVPAKGLASLL